MSNATVSYIINGKAGSCTTAANRSWLATGLSQGGADITLSVIGLTHVSATYQAADDSDPDADSDGITIVLTL